MAKTKQADAADEPAFVLKHRVVGAAFLIFFGALVLPWLLGPPSEANRENLSSTARVDTENPSSEQIEDDLLAEFEQDPPVEEEVYISKITPLDSQNDSQATDGADGADPASAGAESGDQASETASAQQKADELAAQRAAEAKAERDRAAQIAAEKEEQEKRRRAEALAKRQADIENDLAEALEAEAADVAASGGAASAAPPAAADNAKQVEIGWAVQVGLFENKTGANRVVEDLKSKGFKPSVTIVDTNRGKATGTRVWLGPFAQRVEAAKEMSRLAERTGQAGFIRAYP